MDAIPAVVTDLMAQSRIAAAAKGTGRRVTFVTCPERLPSAGEGPALVDLDARLDVLAAIRALKGAGFTVIVFGPHLDTVRRKEARAAGADRVLANSKFMTELPRIMGYVAP